MLGLCEGWFEVGGNTSQLSSVPHTSGELGDYANMSLTMAVKDESAYWDRACEFREWVTVGLGAGLGLACKRAGGQLASQFSWDLLNWA